MIRKMKNITQWLIMVGAFGVVVWVLFGSPGAVEAQNQAPNDCANLVKVDPNTFPQAFENSREKRGERRLGVFTDKDMTVAVKHLQAHCCTSRIAWTESCENVDIPNKKIYTESPFLVDHLMYIGMKKFDGIQDDCDALWIDCQPRDLPVDPVAWRTEIREIGEDIKWYPPSMIQNKFSENWSVKENNDSWSWSPVTDGSTFPNAYNYMCNDLQNITSIMADSDWTSWVASPSGQSIWDWCRTLIRQRIAREQNYIQSLMVEKWRKYMLDNVKSYVYKYFIDDRLASLMGKYTDLDACFRNVLKKIDKTSCCNT